MPAAAMEIVGCMVSGRGKQGNAWWTYEITEAGVEMLDLQENVIEKYAR